MKKILLLTIISYALIFNVIPDASSEPLKVNPIEDNTLTGFGPSSSNSYTEKEIKQMDLILTPQSIRSATLGMISVVKLFSPLLARTATMPSVRDNIPATPISIESAFYSIVGPIAENVLGNKPVPIDGYKLQEMVYNHPYIQVIDVRTPEEYRQIHIPGSTSIPLQKVNTALKNGEINMGNRAVFTCQDGFRGYLAALLANTYGHQDIYYLEAGTIGSWVKSGLPTEGEME